jgi:hypothetical protein
MSDSNILNSVFDETSNLGKATTSITFVISIIVGIILIIFAIYFGNLKSKPYVKAFIKSANCVTDSRIINNRIERSYGCLLNLNYNINNVEYINDISVNSSTVYNPNTFIDIEYDESNPNLINIKSLENSTISYISVGIAILIIVASWMNSYLSNQSKTYASLQGFSTIGSFFGSKRS